MSRLFIESLKLGSLLCVVMLSSFRLHAAVSAEVYQALTKSEVYLQRNQLALALNTLDQLKPKSAKGYANEDKANIARMKGIIYQNQHQPKQAYAAYHQALSLNVFQGDDRLILRRALGGLALQQGKNREAYHHYQAYLDEYPDHAPTLANQAQVLLLLDQPGQALALSEKVNSNSDQQSRLTAGQVKLRAQYQLQRYLDVVTTSQYLLTHFDAQSDWWLLQADAYHQLGQNLRAGQVLAQGIKQGDVSPSESYPAAAQFLAKSGDPQQAAELLDKAITQQQLTDNIALQRQRLNYYLQAGLWNKAEAMLNRIQATTPSVDLANIQLGLYEQQQRWLEVIPLAQQLIDQGGGQQPSLWRSLGIAAMKSQQLKMAEYAFTQLAQLAPDSDAKGWLTVLELQRTNSE
ncbi:tetratricopeptide repeat protein [Photobacterium sagamiensis]|uniref:tetratricopeptide repeat protein n=1 Tax=Photobacterium sagamiensis TaxID=2910241 RepID=UPI003D11CC09